MLCLINYMYGMQEFQGDGWLKAGQLIPNRVQRTFEWFHLCCFHHLHALYDAILSQCTLGSRGYFFLIDTDGSRQSRVNEAQSSMQEEGKTLETGNR